MKKEDFPIKSMPPQLNGFLAGTLFFAAILFVSYLMAKGSP